MSRIATISLLTCLVLNAAVFVWIKTDRPEYLADFHLNPNPDAVDYVRLGNNLVQRGVYSRSDEEPYVLDVLRTPGYPVFTGLLHAIGGTAAVYIAQIALHAGICVLIYLLGRKLFGRFAGALASLFVAADLVVVSLNFQAMSDVLFAFLLTAVVYLLLSWIAAKPAETRSWSRWPLIAAGLLTGLSVQVRPVGIHLPLLWGLLVFAWPPAHRSWARRLADASIVAVIAILAIIPWTLRNAIVFDIPHLTTNDTIVMVYFTGAGAYQVEHGIERVEAQQRIAREFDIHPPEDMWNYHRAGLSPAEMDKEARAVVPDVLSKYPAALVQSSLLGVIKAFFSHSTDIFADMAGGSWEKPGFGNLLRGDADAWKTLLRQDPRLVAIFFAQLNHVALVVGFAIVGVIVAVSQPSTRAVGWAMILISIYFAALIGASGIDAYWRFRMPAMPVAYLAAGYGASQCCAWLWRKRSRDL